MTPEQLHILRHSLGLSKFDRIEKSYRNRYCADSNPDLEALVAAGLMKKSAYSGEGLVAALWVVTEAGILAVRDARVEPPKLSRSALRYRKYLRSELNESFGEYLRNGWYKETA